PPALAPVPQPHQLHQLVVHLLRLRVVAANRGRRAMLQVIPQQLAPNASQRLLDRRYLHQDIGAVALLLDHFLQPSHLPLDASQPLLVLLLDLGIDGDRLPARAAPAGRSVLHARPSAAASCSPPRSPSSRPSPRSR